MKPLVVDVCCGEERWAAGGESALATSAPNTQQRPESRCLEAGWIVRDGGQQQQQHSKNWWSLGNHFVKIPLSPNCRLPHSAWRRAYVYLCLFLMIDSGFEYDSDLYDPAAEDGDGSGPDDEAYWHRRGTTKAHAWEVRARRLALGEMQEEVEQLAEAEEERRAYYETQLAEFQEECEEQDREEEEGNGDRSRVDTARTQEEFMEQCDRWADEDAAEAAADEEEHEEDANDEEHGEEEEGEEEAEYEDEEGEENEEEEEEEGEEEEGKEEQTGDEERREGADEDSHPFW